MKKAHKTYPSILNPNQDELTLRGIARIERLNESIKKAKEKGYNDKLKSLEGEKQRRCQELKELADKIYKLVR
ncbi:MAG: hypothetical protein ACN2B6_00025 [Rickettsiales bacterium]